MMRGVLWVAAVVLLAGGCAAPHQPNPNAVMMENVIGELDRETAK